VSAHTPGPWAIYDERRVFARGLVCECRVPLENDPEDDEWDSPEVAAAEAEAAANARLIAAAPDLLAACRAMAACCGPAETWNGETNAALRMIEAAVAKAEGRS